VLGEINFFLCLLVLTVWDKSHIVSRYWLRVLKWQIIVYRWPTNSHQYVNAVVCINLSFGIEYRFILVNKYSFHFINIILHIFHYFSGLHWTYRNLKIVSGVSMQCMMGNLLHERPRYFIINFVNFVSALTPSNSVKAQQKMIY